MTTNLGTPFQSHAYRRAVPVLRSASASVTGPFSDGAHKLHATERIAWLAVGEKKFAMGKTADERVRTG
jgi:hypothetical protein